jgi:uncharacterized protein (DUF2267 family)
MDEHELIVLIKEHAGLRTAGEARRALGAAFGALRCAMDEDEAVAVSKSLPPGLARLLERKPGAAARSTRALYAEAARREGVDLGFAMEHAQVVFQVLAQALEPELVSRLRRHLPPDIGALLRPRHVPEDAPPHVHAHPAHQTPPRQTLSGARPGTAEPISETQHDVAHAGSVARSGAPHAERMVETARSTRPGREDETLASARGKRESGR